MISVFLLPAVQLPYVPESAFHLPAWASSIAQDEKHLLLWFTAISAIFAIAIFSVLIFFCIRFRKGADVSGVSKRRSNIAIEATWIGIPLLLGIVMYAWAAQAYVRLISPPPGSQEIYVLGKQWMWKMYRQNGPAEINELHVPVGQATTIILASQDVIHSFFVPAFGVKMDAVPGRFTRLWFQSAEIGTFHLFCAQYCGTDHARMSGEIVVMSAEDYARWLSDPAPAENAANAGKAIYLRLGCAGCHMNSRLAPPLAGIFGHPVPLQNGEMQIVDENYLRDAIIFPGKLIVRGYGATMPSYAGRLSEEDLIAVIFYIKSLQNEQTGAAHE